MYANVSNDFKIAVDSRTVTGTAKIYIPSLDIWIMANKTETVNSSLIDLTLKDNCYVDGKLLGTSCSKEVEIQIRNKDNLDLADKEFELYLGVKLSDDTYEYVPYGSYIVTEYTDTKSNNIFKVIAYDYMTKLNPKYQPYIPTKDIAIDNTKTYYIRVLVDNTYVYEAVQNPVLADISKYYEKQFAPTYPISLKNFKEQMLTAFNIEYENQTLPNDDFVIAGDPRFRSIYI